MKKPFVYWIKLPNSKAARHEFLTLAEFMKMLDKLMATRGGVEWLHREET